MRLFRRVGINYIAGSVSLPPSVHSRAVTCFKEEPQYVRSSNQPGGFRIAHMVRQVDSYLVVETS